MAGSKILIVEDEHIVALDIRLHLQKCGYTVPGIFSSGEEALEHMEELQPDIVLMDIQLQGELDGVETASIIKEKYRIPVILLTAYADDTTIERAKITQPFGYIIKPFEERELRTAIEIALYRYQMERKLLDRERLFFTTLNSIGDAVVVTDIDGVIEFINPVAEQLCTVLNAEAVGKRFGDLFLLTPEESNGRAAAPDLAILTARPASGNVRVPVELRSSPLRDEQGEELGTVWVLRDISERLEAERSLKRSEERYRKFFQEDLSGDFVARADGLITDCNLSFVRLFRFGTVEEVTGRDLNHFFPDDQSRTSFWQLVNRNRKVELLETTFHAADGNPVTVLANLVGQFTPDGILEEVKGYFVDTTERRKLEEQLRHSQKMEAIGRLAGGVAHDFNNLLTVIMGYSNLILDVLPENSDLRADVEGIQKATRKGVNLTRQLLTFSRHQVMRMRVTDLNSLVLEMEKMIRRLITEDITMHMYMDAELANVYVDPGQVEQVLINLAVNARDAMLEGGSLIIRTRNEQVLERLPTHTDDIPEGFYTVLEVRDSGIGIDEKYLTLIFEPFFTTKESSQGTGLGLSTVYGIVKQSGGYIRVDSRVGMGTSFLIYIPTVDLPSEEEDQQVRGSERFSGSETILVVEDEENVRFLVSRMLTSRGYHVLEAQNAGEALLICEEYTGTIHLLVSDVVMPHVTGNKLAERLQQIRPDIRVLLMSGYPDKVIEERGLLSPDCEFIQKPFDLEVFIARIRDILDVRTVPRPS